MPMDAQPRGEGILELVHRVRVQHREHSAQLVDDPRVYSSVLGDRIDEGGPDQVEPRATASFGGGPFRSSQFSAEAHDHRHSTLAK